MTHSGRGFAAAATIAVLAGCLGKVDPDNASGLRQGQAGGTNDATLAPGVVQAGGGSSDAGTTSVGVGVTTPVPIPLPGTVDMNCTIASLGLPAPDYTKPLLYWTECNMVRASSLDGTHGAIIARGTFPMGVAVDAVAKKIYWTDNGTDTVERANLDGTGREVLYTAEDRFTNPNAVAVDHVSNRIYWTEFPAVEHTSPSTGVIRAAALDGSGQSIFYTGSDPTGVAVDDASGVYFSDNGTDSITRGDRFGGPTTVIYTNPDAYSNPASVAATAGEVLVGQAGGVWRMKPDGTSPIKMADAAFVDGVAYDPGGKLLYFTDNGADTVSSVGYDGAPPTVIYKAKSAFANPHGVAVFRP